MGVPIFIDWWIELLGALFPAWRRGGDYTKRGTTAPLPFSTPRAPTQWKHKSSILCLQSIPADIRPWKATILSIFDWWIELLGALFPAWRRGGDYTKRGTTAPLPFSIPRAPTQWKHKSSILCLQSIPALFINKSRPWKAGVFAIRTICSWYTFSAVTSNTLEWIEEFVC